MSTSTAQFGSERNSIDLACNAVVVAGNSFAVDDARA
jgi:hypothetical protein